VEDLDYCPGHFKAFFAEECVWCGQLTQSNPDTVTLSLLLLPRQPEDGQYPPEKLVPAVMHLSCFQCGSSAQPIGREPYGTALGRIYCLSEYLRLPSRIREVYGKVHQRGAPPLASLPYWTLAAHRYYPKLFRQQIQTLLLIGGRRLPLKPVIRELIIPLLGALWFAADQRNQRRRRARVQAHCQMQKETDGDLQFI
jgi:hypothetical protein